MKKTAMSASSSSSASDQRSEPRATERSNRNAANDRNSLDIVSKNSSTGARRVKGRRILVIRAGALGDTILALPALRALHEWNQGGSLDLAGYPSVLQVARLAIPVHAIHSVDRALFTGLFSDGLPAELQSFLRSFDLIVAWVSEESVDLRQKLDRTEMSCIQRNPYPPPGTGVHASLHLLQSLAPLGIRDRLSPPKLEFPIDVSRAAQKFLTQAGLKQGCFLAIHSGSGSALKNWEPKRFGSLATRARDSGQQVLIIEGEADREAAVALRGTLAWRPQTAAGLSLPVLGAVLFQAGVFVGNDSGVSHLAAASGAPTIALFGPTDPAVWAPLGPSVEILPQTASDQTVWEASRRLAR